MRARTSCAWRRRARPPTIRRTPRSINTPWRARRARDARTPRGESASAESVRHRMHVAAGLARARRDGTVEALEHCGEIGLDVPQHEEFLVQLVVAAFAEPQQTVLLVRQALALDDQADRAGHALRRVRHARRQIEDLAGADRHVARAAVLLDPEHHLAFELVEEFRTLVPVVVAALVRAADHHDDEVAVDDALVADRRLEQVPVLVDPFAEIDRRGEHVSDSPAVRRCTSTRSRSASAAWRCRAWCGTAVRS